MSFQPTEELAELLSAQTEGELDAASARRLEELIGSDAEAMRFYVEYCQVHAMLAWEHGVLGGPPESAPCPMPPLPTWHEWLLPHWTWMVAVALLLASGVAAWHWPRRPAAVAWERRETVGTVTRSVGARLDVLDVRRPFATDGALRIGHYRLAEGAVEMTLDSRVTVLAEAPAQFRIVSPISMVLEKGRVAARVLESGVNFELQTPDAHVTDFGTEFAVDVTAGEGTEVHVFDGRVDVRPTFGEDVEPVHLAANQATRVDRASSVPRGIDCDPARFLRHLDEPMVPYYAQAVLALQPVVYLRMTPSDDGRTLFDSSPGEHHARIERGADISSPFAAGRVGHALCLGGPTAKQYAVVPDYPKAHDHTLTVMAWVQAESRPRWASIAKNWAKDFGVNHGGQFHLGLYHDEGSLEGHVHDAAGNEVWAREDGVPLPLNQWHHVALVADGTTLRLYRNGAEVAAVPCAGLSTFTPPELGIGAKLDETGRATDHKTTGFWHGRIDELAVFNHALSAEQIRELYHFGKAASDF